MAALTNILLMGRLPYNSRWKKNLLASEFLAQVFSSF